LARVRDPEFAISAQLLSVRLPTLHEDAQGRRGLRHLPNEVDGKVEHVLLVFGDLVFGDLGQAVEMLGRDDDLHPPGR